jgi:anti-anti-sigma factor
MTASLPSHTPSESSPGLDFTVRFDDDRTALVRLKGEIDHANRAALSLVLEGIEAAGVVAIALDARDVTFVDGSLVDVLEPASRHLDRVGGSLQIVRASGVVRRVLALTRTEWLLGPQSDPAGPASGSPR